MYAIKATDGVECKFYTVQCHDRSMAIASKRSFGVESNRSLVGSNVSELDIGKREYRNKRVFNQRRYFPKKSTLKIRWTGNLTLIAEEEPKKRNIPPEQRSRQSQNGPKEEEIKRLLQLLKDTNVCRLILRARKWRHLLYNRHVV